MLKEYEKYQKKQGKEDAKLKEALKKIDISLEQLAEAKSLQKKAFYTFEKMDEKTQRYSDDVEGAADIIRTFASVTTCLIGEGLTALLAFRAINKGKTPGRFTFLPMLLSVLVNIPLEIKSIQIKKQAGKIGLMTAMKDLEDPKNFINKDEPNVQISENNSTSNKKNARFFAMANSFYKKSA